VKEEAHAVRSKCHCLAAVYAGYQREKLQKKTRPVESRGLAMHIISKNRFPHLMIDLRAISDSPQIDTKVQIREVF